MIFENHITSTVFSSLGKLLAGACLALAGLPAYAQAQETVWFVMADRPDVPPRNDASFLLPLSNPANIAEARRLIDEGAGIGFTVARIARGGDGFNRDYRFPPNPFHTPLAWSWRVTEFVRFNEDGVTTGTCIASPTSLELGPQFNNCTTVEFVGYGPVAELEEPPAFFISEGLNGTWYNPETSGQGVTVDVLAERGLVFLTWVTYAAGGPAGGPSDGQAWVTAQGSFEGNSATLDAYVSTGGAFDSPATVTTRPIGRIELEFSDCNHGVLRYAFDDGLSGEFPITRIISRPGCVSRLADLRRRDESAD